MADRYRGRAKLEELPGVGRQDRGNVPHRLRRTHFIPSTRTSSRRQPHRNGPQERRSRRNESRRRRVQAPRPPWLILHWRYTCVARKPLCKVHHQRPGEWPGKRSHKVVLGGAMEGSRTGRSTGVAPADPMVSRAGLPINGRRTAQVRFSPHRKLQIQDSNKPQKLQHRC